MNVEEINARVKESSRIFLALRQEIGKVVVGQEALLNRLLIGLLANGHLLLEGLPGLAKTLSVKTLAKALDVQFQRIQFTPDLLPSDLTGISVYNPKDGSFSFRKGPIFTNLLLADEINRAAPKVQSALLEIMEERQVTFGAETWHPGDPFLVLATQNPIEQEGTYPLPEAQSDRFMMKICLKYPSKEEEREIARRMGEGGVPLMHKQMGIEALVQARIIVRDVYLDEKILQYILDLVFATRESARYGIEVQKILDYGASPRATLALMAASKAHAFLMGRGFVIPHDVKSIAPDVLRHRLRLSYEGEAQGLTPDTIIHTLLERIPVP